MNPDTTQTPRTDEACEVMGLKAFVVPVETSRQLERELSEKTNEVARLRELFDKVLFELEKVPFQTPKLTAFTAHRLADRYREQNQPTNQMNPQTPENEVARLKEMLMDAARRGDMMAAHWKERAEKAEALIQQLHHLAELLPEANKA